MNSRSTFHATLILGLAALTFALTSSSCTGEDTKEGELLAGFIDYYVDGYFLPASAQWATDVAALSAAAPQCEGTTRDAFIAGGYTTVTTDFERAWTSWNALLLARFGPFDEAPLRLHPKIDGGPVDPSVVDDAIAAQVSAEGMREIGANRRGFPALDYVLYDVMRRTDLAPETFTNACNYLVAATADLGFLAEEWNRGYLDDSEGYIHNFTDPASSDVVSDELEALTLLIQNTGDALYVAREDVIVGPRGAAPEGSLNLPTLRARSSGLTLEGLDATVNAARQVIVSEDGAVTIGTLYATRRDTAADEIRDAFAAYDTARARMTVPLEEALQTQLDDVNALNDAVRGLSTLVLADIMGGLGLAVSFVDADGD